MYAEDLNGHYWPIFGSRDVGNTEAWPADNVGIANVLVPIDPFLETKVLSTHVLVDVDIGRKDLLLIVWRDKHLAYQRFVRGWSSQNLHCVGRMVLGCTPVIRAWRAWEAYPWTLYAQYSCHAHIAKAY